MIQYNKGIRESRLDHYLLTVGGIILTPSTPPSLPSFFFEELRIRVRIHNKESGG